MYFNDQGTKSKDRNCWLPEINYLKFVFDIPYYSFLPYMISLYLKHENVFLRRLFNQNK